MTADDRPKRPLADDPKFLAGLSDLDIGVTDEARAGRESSVPSVATPAAPPTPPAAGSRRRRLIDLFPPDLFPPAPAGVPRPTETLRPPLGAPRPANIARQPAPRVESSPPSDARTYETFYGLHERPFSLSTDPRLLYSSAAYDRASQAMLDAIRRRDGIVVLTGELGMGKTMLCRAIVEQLDRRTLTSLVDGPFATSEELLKRVLVDFGVVSREDVKRGLLARKSQADLAAALRDFLYSLAALQAFAVVIIDDAHKLPADLLEEIRVLADAGGDEPLLQVMLVGQPSLHTTLSRPQLRQLFQRVSKRVSLGPLSEDEIGGYVAHRLAMAGTNPRVEFDDESIDRLYALSGGAPRIINLLCERALAVGHAASASTIIERFVETAAADLDLAPPRPRRSALRVALAVLGFALLVVLGAAAGAFVFRSDVAALVRLWQAVPAPPAPPPIELPRPYASPAALDAEQRAAQDLL